MQMMNRDCTVPYGEVDGFSALLGYQTANAAGCKVTATSTSSDCCFTEMRVHAVSLVSHVYMPVEPVAFVFRC